jgi:hypothetical protein
MFYNIQKSTRIDCPKKVRHYFSFMERKVKYDYAFKLECVKLVLENIIHVLCFKSKGPNESNIRKWVEFIVNMRTVFPRRRTIRLILN